MLVILIVGTYGVYRWDGFMWHDIHTNFHENLYKLTAWAMARPFYKLNIYIMAPESITSVTASKIAEAKP
jgi:hypothetical protein